jgi:hypothetical protein
MPLTNDAKTAITEKLRKLLRKYAPPMVIAKESENGVELIGNKPVPYGSKKEIIPGMFFSSFVARKDMVSFYFFPMYMDPENFMKLIPENAKCLKGKTCFNFKKPEQVNEKELDAMLKKGVKAWKDAGYMK